MFDRAVGADHPNFTYCAFADFGGNHDHAQSSDDEKVLSILKLADRQGYYVPGCMEGTRIDAFKMIQDWLDRLRAPNILRISGSPGASKSAVASSLVFDLTKQRRLASRFFFKCGDTSALGRTVAFDLARYRSDLKSSLVEFLRGSDIRDAEIKLHFECMIEEPLRKNLEKLPKPVVFVLDALDECGSDDSQSAQRRILLDTLTSWSRLPSSIKLIFTSRDERLPNSFREGEICQHIILETGDSVSPSTTSDIRTFFEKHFAEITAELGLPYTWPGQIAIHQMTERAAGHFIWATTAMEFMEEEKERGSPHSKLKLILDGKFRKLDQGTDNIDTLYREVLDFHFKNSDDSMLELLRAVLGVIVVAKLPLRREDLKHFLDIREDEEWQTSVIIHRLSSVISKGDHDGVLRLKHRSFSEFLSDPRRCRDHRFVVDCNGQHQYLSLACLRLMNGRLKFNICNLETSYRRNKDVEDLSSRVEKSIPSYLSYSCRFWAEHLDDSTHTKQDKHHDDLRKEIENFLHVRLLYWFEALSLIEEVSLAFMALQTTARWIAPFDSDLSAFAIDASRFIVNFHVPISESAPQIYLSALPFSPSTSKISKHFLPQFPHVLGVTGLENHWSALMNTLISHTDRVNSVAFSPDGMRVVSGSSDNTIRIWDAETGQMVSGPFEGHTNWVRSVAFSPDGKRVVSGSDDKTIRIWDAKTGRIVSGPFEGHTGWVFSVAFSPDGKRIVSGSSDMTIRIWNAKTGQKVSGPLEGHTRSVYSVAFSPNGKRIVSGSLDTTVRIWDAKTGRKVSGPFEGHNYGVNSVAFSPNGKHVVSGSHDGTIRIWDAKTGQMVSGPFEGHTSWVFSVAFSPNGKHVISGSNDKTIRIWDAKTGQMASGPFEGHTNTIYSVAFSPDGKRVVSGSSDKTIRIWDAETDQMMSSPFEGHTGGIYSVAFSPDGEHVVSGSLDKTIRIWDAETSRMVSGPFGGQDSINSVAFSPDGKRVVSGSYKTIQIWDAKTGQMVSGTIEGTNFVHFVAFSPDGKRVVSGSDDDKTIRIWDAETGRMVSGPFEGHSCGVLSAAFSPDGNRVVSGSGDRTIRIWDAETGQIVSGPFEGHTHWVRSVAFSPDGKRVVSGSEDKTVRIWDAKTGRKVSGPFEGHTNAVHSVAFSPNGKHVVSGSEDNTIQIWDAETGQVVSGPFEGHLYGVESVAFSPNGERVVSGSGDGTIRIWHVETGQTASDPFQGHTSRVAFSPDGKSVISGVELEEGTHWATNDFISTHGFVVDTRDGWVFHRLSDVSEYRLLFWVPPHHWQRVCTMRTPSIMGMQRTIADFSRFAHGSSWTQCRSPLGHYLLH